MGIDMGNEEFKKAMKLVEGMMNGIEVVAENLDLIFGVFTACLDVARTALTLERVEAGAFRDLLIELTGYFERQDAAGQFIIQRFIIAWMINFVRMMADEFESTDKGRAHELRLLVGRALRSMGIYDEQSGDCKVCGAASLFGVNPHEEDCVYGGTRYKNLYIRGGRNGE
jgi:hypothetical protein